MLRSVAQKVPRTGFPAISPNLPLSGAFDARLYKGDVDGVLLPDTLIVALAVALE